MCKPNLTHILLYITILVSINIPAYAAPFFYRHDMVDAEDAFRIGFIPSGNNDNMYEHIRGTSCFEGNASSAFISTTSSESMAHIMAETNTPEGMIYYMYMIRPTNNFFNSVSSLRAAFVRTGDIRFEQTISDYMHEQEWLALGTIETEQIHSARAYRSNGFGRQSSFLGEYLNPAYLDFDTFPNTGNYFIPNLPSDSENEVQTCMSCYLNSRTTDFKREVKIKNNSWFFCEKKITSLILNE